jgi:phosphopantothenoylcysteine decarboxylase/phosphopantothenate--cysteine ligase
VEENSKKKLEVKNCDWIIANDVSNKAIGFDSNFNEVSIYYRDKDMDDERLTIKSKSEISDEIVERVIKKLN